MGQSGRHATAPAEHLRLPAEPTRLVGRERDAEDVRLLLAQTRLLTLAGPGGCGKSRLALRVAGRTAAGFPDGVWWVELASLADPHLVPERVAEALGVAESPGRSVTPAVIDFLAPLRGLLVLDNCEHLLDGCAGLVDRLLRSVAALRVLATSREPLGVAGEVSWPVPPLPVPDLDPSADADPARYPSVELFVDRARAARPGFAPTGADLAAIAELCRRLDGIPLAIELAAARVRVLSPAQLLDRLRRDLHVLADRGRSGVARHRTLLATMAWSHDLLSDDERRLFRRLSVFAGTFGLEAAERVGSGRGIPPDRVLDLLSGLVEKSLVLAEQAPDGGVVRYRMLETVRRYAGSLLAGSAEPADTTQVHATHADFFLDLSRAAEPGLLGPDQPGWVRRLGHDRDNIAAALAWLRERGDAVRGLELAGRLGRFWWFAGQFTEGAGWLRAFLALPAAAARTGERARALHALGLATFWHESPGSGWEASRTHLEEAADICRELGDDRALVAVLRDLGGYFKGAGDPARARAALHESVAVARRLGDECAVASATAYLGVVAAYTGEVDHARDLLDRSLATLRGRGGADELIRAMFFLACLDCDAGDPVAARAMFEELMKRDPLAALPYAGGFALDGLARIAAAEGQPHRALRVAGAARAAHDRLGTAAGPAYDEYVRRGLAPARRLIGESAAERAFRRGRAITLAEALAEGLRTPSPGGRTTGVAGTAGARDGVLSAREAEVLGLAADGLGDADIAAALHLSRRTVGNHLGSAYRKLGVGSRTAAIREARELGLL